MHWNLFNDFCNDNIIQLAKGYRQVCGDYVDLKCKRIMWVDRLQCSVYGTY